MGVAMCPKAWGARTLRGCEAPWAELPGVHSQAGEERVHTTAVEGAAGEAFGGLGVLGLAALAATLILLIAVGKPPRGAGLYRIH